MQPVAKSQLDAVVIGSGPNGLAAAVALAEQGFSVLVLEASDELGGGTRTAELTLPGFRHDVCSAVHPLGELSPFLSTLPLDAARPALGEPGAFRRPSARRRARRHLAALGRGYGGRPRPRRPGLCQADATLVRLGRPLLADLLGPLRVPHHPLAMARFGFYGLRSAVGLGRGLFARERARALLAGCAAHSILPLEMLMTGAVGMMFAFTGHLCDWPVARGGSAAVSNALASYLRSLGGRTETGRRVTSLRELPEARAILFDLAPKQLARDRG